MALGNGTYQVMATDMGGKTRFGEVTQLTSLHFDRVKDDTSTCEIVVNGPDDACCELLAGLRTGRHELVVYRDGHRVWEGPITRLGYRPERVEIDARDLTWLLSRRAMEVGINYTGTRYPAGRMLLDVLSQHYPAGNDPRNIGDYVTLITGPDDANTAAHIKAYTRTLFNLLDQYAARGGLDYTVTGRRLLIMDAHTRTNVLPKIDDSLLSGSVNVTEYGQELKTRVFTTNNEDFHTEAAAPDEWLEFYGPIDFVNDNTDESGGNPTDAEDIEAIKEVTHRILETGYPTPVRLWVEDDSRLDPCYEAEFSQLQACSWVPIQSSNTCRKLSQWQKVMRVRVDWQPGDEKVGITLGKAPAVMVEPSGILTRNGPL